MATLLPTTGPRACKLTLGKDLRRNVRLSSAMRSGVPVALTERRWTGEQVLRKIGCGGNRIAIVFDVAPQQGIRAQKARRWGCRKNLEWNLRVAWIERRIAVRLNLGKFSGTSLGGGYIAPPPALAAVPGQLRFHRKRQYQQAQAAGQRVAPEWPGSENF